MKVLELAKRFIQIESISGQEKAMADELASILRSQGWAVKIWNSKNNRPNIFAYLGKPEVIFSSHLDTVPPYLNFREDRHHIYGRGACDAKGIIAAQLTAGFELQKKNIRNIGFLYLVGEEVDHQGAIDVAHKMPHVKALVMGEPTENKMAVGTKGIVKVSIHARGKACHSAYPKLGRSAIDELLNALSHIQKIKLPKHSTLGETNLNIGILNGGVAANVLAPQASAQILVRTVGSSRAFFQMMKRCETSHVSLNLESMNDPIVLNILPQFKKTVVAFNTDLPYLKSLADKIYLIGPGSIHHAHSPHERISKKDLMDAVRIYQKIGVSEPSSNPA